MWLGYPTLQYHVVEDYPRVLLKVERRIWHMCLYQATIHTCWIFISNPRNLKCSSSYCLVLIKTTYSFSTNQFLQQRYIMKVLAVTIFPILPYVSANQFLHLGRLIPPIKATDESSIMLESADVINDIAAGSAFFSQFLDHDDRSKGTFQQKFWWDAEWWAGPGSPVVLFTPGEVAAAPYWGYLTNKTITGEHIHSVLSS